MRRLFKKSGEDFELERRLRKERPRPSDELVLRVSEQARARETRRRVPLGLAYSVTGVFLAAAIALGGLGSPIDSAGRILSFDSAGSKGSDHGKPAKDEYEEKVTICHRPPGNPRNGQTLRLSSNAAKAHLRNHRYDSRGPCSRKGHWDKDHGNHGNGHHHGNKPKHKPGRGR